MSDDEFDRFHDFQFFRMVFAGVLAMQYHPRNEVSSDDDLAVISRCVDISAKAVAVFGQRYPFRDDIPF